MFQPKHVGLYFSRDQIQHVRAHQAAEPYAGAWALLHQRKPLELLEIAQWGGLLYRFADDVKAGARTVEILQQQTMSQTGATAEQIATLMAWAQCFEMVRDHPNFVGSDKWLERFALSVDQVNAAPEKMFVDLVWQNALNMVASILLEDVTRFEHAIAVFKDIIRYDVHPDGYIRRAAEGEKGMSLYRMLLAAQALILTAEAAAQAGEDLWAFNERGVSALTPTPYLLYYYYFPEKWRWDAEVEANEVPEEGQSLLTEADVHALYRRHGGLWELAQHQSFSKDRQTLLDDLRPVVDVWGGGLVTLTHGVTAPKKKRFGLF